MSPSQLPARRRSLPVASLLGVALALGAHGASAQIQPEARELAAAVGAKLAGARTVRVTARHELSPGLEIPAAGNRAPVVITLQRPNQFHAIQPAKHNLRELVFDGETLCLMYPLLGHHAMVPLRARTIDAFADEADRRFGLRPPLAELFSEDLPRQLFEGAKSARLIPNEPVGWDPCHRIQIGAGDLAGDLWISVKNRLPRRYRLTFLDRPGRPTWDIHLSRWELNPAIDPLLFARRPPAGSVQVQMVRTH